MNTPEQSSATRICPACGNRHSTTFAACPFCGARAVPVRDYAAIAETAMVTSRPFVALTWHPAAVVTLDLFFDLNWGAAGQGPDDDAWRPTAGQQTALTALGAFFGELIRREIGGVWHDDPEHRDDALRAKLVLPGGAQVYPISRAWKRMKGGAAESFEVLYNAVRRATGTVPAAGEAAGWMEQARYFEKIGRYDLAGIFCERASALGVDAPTRAEIDIILARAHAAARQDAAAASASSEPPSASAEPAVAAPPAAPAPERAPPPAASAPEIVLDAETYQALAHANALVREGDHLGTLAAFDHVLELEPAVKAGLIGRAAALLALLRFDEARAWLDSFAMRDDCEPERSLLAAMAADQAGDVPAAYDLYFRVTADRRLPNEHRHNAAARARALAEHPAVLAHAIEKIEDLGAAVEAYRRLCTAHPDYADGWRELGVGLTLLDRGEEALPCFARAAELEPADPRSYDHMAVTLARLGRLDDAIAALDDGLRHCQEVEDLKFRKGVLQGSAGRNAEALALFGEVIRANPAHPDVWANKADIELREVRIPEAMESMERFLRNNPARIGPRMQAAREKLWSLRHPGQSRDPARAQVLNDRAINRALAGDIAGALADFEASIAADPLVGHCWFNRATCLVRDGRIPEALASCEEAEALLGATAEVTDLQVALQLKLGRGDDAVLCHDRNLAYGKPRADRLHAKVRTLLQVGRPADALPILHRLIAQTPFDLVLRRERAEALAAAGRRHEAIAAINVATAMAPEDPDLLAARGALGGGA